MDIPADWWKFCEMDKWKPSIPYFLYKPAKNHDGREREVIIVPLRDIQPPQRDEGLAPFKKYKMVPVLFAFQSPERVLPPVDLIPANGDYAYKLTNGFHRFYASKAVGFSEIPAHLEMRS